MFSTRPRGPLVDLMLQKQGAEPFLDLGHPVPVKHSHYQCAEERATIV